MSGTKAILLAIVVVALAIANGERPLDYLALALVGVVVLSWFWSWASVLGLGVTRRARPTRAQVGQTIEERITLTAPVPMPRPWLEFRDHSTLPGHAAGWVVGQRAGRTWTWSVRTVCARRGEYMLGGATVVGADPLGLFSAARRVGTSQRILVYPRTVDIAGGVLPSISLPGGSQPLPGWHQVTPTAAGVREYMPGDALNRIHWLSTARANRLMVKEFDLDPVPDVWLFLDLSSEPQRGFGDESTEEYGVVAAASLARYYLKVGRAVGLVASGNRHCVIQPDRGDRQLLRILEELAVLRAQGHVPLGEAILSECDRCSRRAVAIAITPSLDERWVAGVRMLRERGMRTAAVLLEPGTFGGGQLAGLVVGGQVPVSPIGAVSESALLVMAALAAADIVVYLLKQGDRLEEALSGRGIGGGARYRRV